MEFILITEGSEEWLYMWEWLEKHPINENIINPKTAENNGTAWEYMGTFMQDKKVIHEFRHLSHPTNNQLIKLTLSSKNILTNDDIAKKFKIK